MNPLVRLRGMSWFGRSVGLLLVVVSTSWSVRADMVDDTVTALMAERQIPGLSLAIVQGGKIVREQAYGVVDLESLKPVTTETLFQAGSVSKPVAALGALALVEAGKLSLDADVNGFLKTWHVPENQFTKEQKVTLRRLLSHGAGVTVHGFHGYAVGEPKPNLVQVLNGEAPANSSPIRVNQVPGTKWRYAGGGYTVMQQAMIDVTGQPFPEFMRKTVLEPLGMSASTYAQPLPEADAARTATGYYNAKKAVPGRWHVYPELAAAGLWTTPSDLARYVIGVQDAWAGRGAKVISQVTAREMLTRQMGNSGLGLVIAGGKGKAMMFSHGGRNEGFDTNLVGYFETGQGAVVMINTNDNTRSLVKIFEAIAEVYQWPDYPKSKRLTAIEDKEPAVTAQVKKIFEDAQQGKFEVELYTPKLGKLVVEAMTGEAQERLKSFGAIKTIELTERKEEGGNRRYQHRLVFEKETVMVNCAYNAEGKIAGLNFLPE
jgi:CubicO group peptidase (beta-lactamase class C family)